MGKIIINGDSPGKKFIIDLDNEIQARYEMIRECSLSREPVEEICKKYHYFRQQYYLYLKRFKENNFKGLISQKRGPKGPTKVIEEVEKEILAIRFRDPHITMFDIANLLKEKGREVSPWSVALVLMRHGVTLKKTKKKLLKT